MAFRNALRETLRELGIEEFHTRTGYDFDEGKAILAKLIAWLGKSDWSFSALRFRCARAYGSEEEISFSLRTQDFVLGYHLSPLRGSALFGAGILDTHLGGPWAVKVYFLLCVAGLAMMVFGNIQTPWCRQR
jgi:hypothetical protein